MPRFQGGIRVEVRDLILRHDLLLLSLTRLIIIDKHPQVGFSFLLWISDLLMDLSLN
jgi:hypothetical protein